MADLMNHNVLTDIDCMVLLNILDREIEEMAKVRERVAANLGHSKVLDATDHSIARLVRLAALFEEQIGG